MVKSKKAPKTANKPLDATFGKRPRGRPGVRKSEIQGRAFDYGLSLKQHWDVLAEPLLKAESEEEYKQLFDNKASYLKTKFVAVAFSLVEKVRKDPKFPKKSKTQQVFFAESFAGRGVISPRRCRDICAELRKNKPHEIIRRDYYIECTCGYEGPAKDGGCRKCGTKELSLRVTVSFSGVHIEASRFLDS